MLELTLRVEREALEDLLDELLPLIPGGVHCRELDDGIHSEVLVYESAGGPPAEEIRELAASRLVAAGVEEVTDDWRARRLRRYRPTVVGPVCLRPEWAPPAPAGTIEVVLGESTAFGTGAHPTTRVCLAAICELDSRGPLADLGCGSGVLAIAAAKLGYAPVVAVDLSPDAVDAAAANARLSGVEIDTRALDLMDEPAPAARTIVANVPPPVHASIAASIAAQLDRPIDAPQTVVASGFGPADVDSVEAAYAELGLGEVGAESSDEWSVLRLSAAKR